MTVEKKHNGKISFWKFMFSLLIIAYHAGFYNESPVFSAGYIGVEFFFIVSGYYLCKKCINYRKIDNDKLGIENFNFVFNKIKKLIPYITCLWILSIPISILINKMSLYDYSSSLMNLFFVPNFESKVFVIYGITWYIAAMLIVEAILFPILIKFRRNYVYNFSFLLVFFLLSYLIINFGNITDPWIYATVSYKGIIRALMDINIGIMIYGILDRFKKVEYTDFSKFVLTIIEIVGYLSIFYICNKGLYKYDFIMLFVLITCLIISFSNKVYLVDFSNNKLFYYLEKLSVPIYINQFIFIELLQYIIKIFNLNISIYWQIVIVIVISIIFAMLFNKFLEWFFKRKDKIKSIFILEN